jgi:uncharacterized membrane protein YqjE
MSRQNSSTGCIIILFLGAIILSLIGKAFREEPEIATIVTVSIIAVIIIIWFTYRWYKKQ